MDIQNFKNILDEDTEFIPLLSTEDEDSMHKESYPDNLPILPLRNTVLFPGVVIPITVGRDKSIKLIKDAYNANKIIGVVAQKDDKIEDPHTDEIHQTGTIAQIIKMLRMPDGNTTAIIQGKRRFKIAKVTATEPYLIADIEQVVEEKSPKNDKEFEALISSLKDISQQIISLSPQMPSEAAIAIKNIESPSFLINFISSNIQAPVLEKQNILEIYSIKERATALLTNLSKELQMSELKNQIQSKVKVDLDKQQRDFFLQQQLKTIQEELGSKTNEQEVEEFKTRAEAKKWNKTTADYFTKEYDKLKRMNPMAAEYSVQSNYLDLLLDLPWNEYSTDNFDLKHAQSVLDADHFGLEKVKDRIIEHLAVLKLKGNMKAPILCLYGPPGVGKTSLGKSIAKALDRSFVRMSLGGLKDESEIRGHRKTYIGAMPGRILQNIKKAKTDNPVFILDEIDKLGNSFQGDPSSALLEVLDPEQNHAFYDNYIETDYDLSKVLFIATANSLQTIQPALLDRMEIIDITGYTAEEKVEIANRHLLPKQLTEHGLEDNALKLETGVIEIIINNYTRESGVRRLEKHIAKLVRYIAKSIAMEEKYSKKIAEKDLEKILGPAIFSRENYIDNSIAGVATGLAWTAVGGEILFIETSLSLSKTPKLTLTGNLGDVMKESAVLALEFLKTHADLLKIDSKLFDSYGVHVHVPEGATPKDGPSAGITMLTALASAFTQRKIKDKIAMTGEITLRGKVLPVGGIKEKVLAAKRAGIQEIILCKENQKDITDIKASYLTGLKFHYVSTMQEVIKIALLKEKVDEPLNFKLN